MISRYSLCPKRAHIYNKLIGLILLLFLTKIRKRWWHEKMPSPFYKKEGTF